MALTKIDDRGLKTPIDLLDNEKIRLGTGNDLELYHDGTNSIIKNTQGQTRLVQDYFAVRNGADNEYMIYGQVDNTVQLYYDGSKKLETTSYGATVSGIFLSTGDIKTGNDTAKFISGASDDLQMYHNGSNSIIEDTGTGQLRLCGNNAVVLRKSPTGDVYALGNADGSFELFYDNSKKLETTSTGVAITGEAALTGGSLKLDSHPLVSTASFTDISGGSYAARLGSTGSSTIRSTQIYGGGGHIATFDGVNVRLGVRTTTPLTGLHVYQDWVNNVGSICAEGSTNALTGYGFRSNGTYKAALIYRDGTAGNYLDLSTYNGSYPILFRPNGTEEVRIDSDGLKFNGDTAAANALDDYEEGTWTPTCTASGGGSWPSAHVNGYYTKVGRLVTVWFCYENFSDQYNTVKGSGGGSAVLTWGGLPFTVDTYMYTPHFATWGFNYPGSLSTGTGSLYCFISDDSTSMEPYFVADNASGSQVTVGVLGQAFIRGQFSYMATA